jgi:hypothetical protein
MAPGPGLDGSGVSTQRQSKGKELLSNCPRAAKAKIWDMRKC